MISWITKCFIGWMPVSIQTFLATLAIAIMLYFVRFYTDDIDNVIVLMIISVLSFLAIITNIFEAKEHCEYYNEGTQGLYKSLFNILTVILVSVFHYFLLYGMFYMINADYFTKIDTDSTSVILFEIWFFSFDNLFSSNLSAISTNSILIKVIASTEVFSGFLFLSLIISDMTKFGKRITNDKLE